MVKILIISSCTKTKAIKHGKQPTCKDLTTKSDKERFRQKLPGGSCKAREMYLGVQHKNILKAITILRRLAEVDFYILSAGFGFVEEEEIIPVYDCSFTKMGKQMIRTRANQLEIESDFSKIIRTKNYDLIYLALGKDYLEALPNWQTEVNTLTVAFSPSLNPKVISLAANSKTVAKLSKQGFTIHGAVGIKGDILRIFAENLQQHNHPNEKLQTILRRRENLERYFENELFQQRQQSFANFLP
ncbi:MAG: hypothetical protein K9W42_13230 [Candidatus Heimdallarchaeota archaeon]|nr:hypothetical protein [Candidatus Heimdallarchaeota archaeon]